ncbi:membrane protein [Clostridium polynesiense]|uniref:membrane protein n=1 Tax=Clostridium polynesiense TaxID=1325933 RepID=UPI00058F310D|nr:membrane protein [Clostridium polynesiense]
MEVILTSLHYVYLVFIILIIAFMVMKKDTSLVSLIGVFVLGLLGTASLSKSLMGVFNGLIYATKELMPTIFIISVITAMSKVLMASGINEAMISPFKRFIKNYDMAYWIIGIVMMIISWFFWPSPAVALIGAIFLPIGKKAGLPAIGVAIAMNLFGHGIALSTDYIIQAAPKLTADAAGIPVGDVMKASIPLTIVMALVTTISAYIILKKEIKSGIYKEELQYAKEELSEENELEVRFSLRTKKLLALMMLIFFGADIVIMYKAKLQGGDATALIGGTALVILSIIGALAYKKGVFEKVTVHLVEGLQFGFKIFGVVIPIAAFFYLGDSAILDIFGKVLPEASKGIVNDLGLTLASVVPVNSAISSITLTTVGAITGLDGSGFSGIPLVGSVARLFSTGLGSGTATLTALGQISGIWIGGGTLIPWAVIPAAAMCGVDPFELTRKNLKPVVIGLAATTIAAMFFL